MLFGRTLSGPIKYLSKFNLLNVRASKKKFTQCAGFMPFDGINLDCRGYGTKIGPMCHREHE